MSPSLNKEVELDDGNRSVWGVKYWVATLCLPLCVLWEIFFKVLALIRILVFASGRNPAWLSWGRKPDFRNGRGAPDSRNHWIRDWGASTTHLHQLSPWLISLGQFYFLTLFLLWARRHLQNLWEVFLARGTRYHEQILLEPQDWLKRAAAPPEKGLLCCPPNQTPESPATPVRHPLPPFSCQLYAPWLRVSTLLEVSAQLHCLWGPTALGPYLSVLPEPLEPICTPEVQCLMLLAVVCVYVFLPRETGNLSKTLTALIDLGLLFKLKYLLISDNLLCMRFWGFKEKSDPRSPFSRWPRSSGRHMINGHLQQRAVVCVHPGRQLVFQQHAAHGRVSSLLKDGAWERQRVCEGWECAPPGLCWVLSPRVKPGWMGSRGKERSSGVPESTVSPKACVWIG